MPIQKFAFPLLFSSSSYKGKSRNLRGANAPFAPTLVPPLLRVFALRILKNIHLYFIYNYFVEVSWFFLYYFFLYIITMLSYVNCTYSVYYFTHLSISTYVYIYHLEEDPSLYENIQKLVRLKRFKWNEVFRNIFRK